MAHTSEAGVLGLTAVLSALVKKMADKGLLNDAEWTEILKGTWNELDRHSDGAGAQAFLSEWTKVAFTETTTN